MEVTGVKVVVLLLLGLVKLVAGTAPILAIRLVKKRERVLRKFIGFALCVGGGVLLATVMVHMVREVRESLDRAAGLGVGLPQDFPVAELVICCGFLLILLIESAAHKHFGGHSHSHLPPSRASNKVSVKAGEQGAVTEWGLENGGYQAEEEGPASVVVTRLAGEPGHHPDLKHDNKKKRLSAPSYQSFPVESQPSSLSGSPASPGRGILLLLALSVHSLFEGMAIGLQETADGVWKLFIAVALHATAIMFCVGTDLLAGGATKLRVVLHITVLSLVGPVGVLVGLLVTGHMEQASGTHLLVVGLLQGLAAGTLLYITFYEVLERQRLAELGMSGLQGALAVCVGFALMAALETLGGHSHGGHDGHEGHAHGNHAGHGGDIEHSQHLDSIESNIKNGYSQHGDHDHHGEHDHEEHHGVPEPEPEHHHDEHDHYDEHQHEEHQHEEHNHHLNEHEDSDDHEHGHNEKEDNEDHNDEHEHGEHEHEEHENEEHTHKSNGEQDFDEHHEHNHDHENDKSNHDEHGDHEEHDHEEHDEHDHKEHDEHDHEDHDENEHTH